MMSNGMAEYISDTVACIKASHLRILIYDLKCMGSNEYGQGQNTIKMLQGIDMM